MRQKAEELEARPGEWEVVRTYPNDRVASVAVSRLKGYGLDAVQRRRTADEVDVWACWPNGAA